VLIDKQQAGNRYAQDEYLEQHDIELYRDCKGGLMHNKVIVVDQEIVLTGSYNFTKNATKRNAENLIVIKNKTIALEYQKESDKLFQIWGKDCR